MTIKNSPRRQGISKENISEAVKRLLKEGVMDPSARAIRHALNDTGSFEVINKYLKQLRTECLSTVLLDAESSTEKDIPESLKQAIIEIWERIQTSAKEEVLQIQQAALDEITKTNQEKKEAIDKANALEAALDKERLQVNHLQADLKLKNDEWKVEREKRIEYEARMQEAEKHLQQVREDMTKRFEEIKQSHQIRIAQLSQQIVEQEKRYQKEIDDLKSLLEDQRQKYVFEQDQLKTAKAKVEQSLSKQEVELKGYVNQLQNLKEQIRALQFDISLAQQRQQEAEKAFTTQQIETILKERALIEWQQKFENAKEETGALKQQINLLQEKVNQLSQPSTEGE